MWLQWLMHSRGLFRPLQFEISYILLKGGYQSKRGLSLPLWNLAAKKWKQFIMSGSRSCRKSMGRRGKEMWDAKGWIKLLWMSTGRTMSSIPILLDLRGDRYRLFLQRVENTNSPRKEPPDQQRHFHNQNTSFTVNRGATSVSAVKETGKRALHSAADQSMVWLMEQILPGHCGSLPPALHPLLSPVYMEVGVDNVCASLMRVLQRNRGQRRVKSRSTSHLGLRPGTRRCYLQQPRLHDLLQSIRYCQCVDTKC